MQRTKILVIGSLNMDLVVHVPRVPSDGETLLVRSSTGTLVERGPTRLWPWPEQGASTIMAGASVPMLW